MGTSPDHPPPDPQKAVPSAADADRWGQDDAGAPPLVRAIVQLWSRVLDLGLVLWVVRIPLLSVAIGLLLMLGVTQAQDTLVDVAMAGPQLVEKPGLSLALGKLILAIFLLWAIPVHFAARLLLDTDDGIAALATRRDQAAARQAAIAEHGPASRDTAGAGAIPSQAGAAPQALAQSTPHAPGDAWTGFVIRQVPRLLGALTFVAFAIGAEQAIVNLPTLTDTSVTQAAQAQLHVIAVAMLVAVPFFFLYSAARGRLALSGPVRAATAALDRLCAGPFRWLAIAPRRNDPSGALHATGRLLLLTYAAGVIIILIANPLWLARQLPLTLAVPLILGAWVPILSYLSSIGRRLHFPFVTAALALGIVGVYLFGDNHKVRTLLANEPAYRRTTLDTAVYLWMRANGCAQAPATCPRPIIVVAAGGASRAGFFTASVVGHFLDVAQHREGYTLTRADGRTLVRGPLDDGRISPPAADALANADIADRIFAISGVSGGAYGAAVTAAALGSRNGRASPCAGAAPPYWFGARITTWQDCLESLTAGDYLTASFFGLAFHDQVQLYLEDRAALLEQSWENRFAQIATEGDRATPQRLSQPLLTAERDPAVWVPFLVLNGTSVETGQRIVTTDLMPTHAPKRPCPSGGDRPECPIFTHAIDFHGFLHGSLDVRLSTAASNSARFPLISPPGSILQGEGDIADRIVDGGYFENFGVESALELAQAMAEVEPRLAPFILVISNDPQSTLTEERTARGVVVPDGSEQVWLPELTGPLSSIGAVRSGRGRLAVAATNQWLNERFGAGCPTNLAHIRVWPEALDGTCPIGAEKPKAIRDVSMSWWLSKPVQMNLRKQLEHSSDRCNNDKAVRAVWAALATPSSACGIQP
ncbi:hypothetical protein [Xanthobacter agilis]|uniref:PNPLA domain-containing protein n=1 Tax=Xanthobacter agilis TaxID=47492 RepID=A0ABU0L9Z2_XANAG|nr:hypothetical protein [Xanthobacter agilis]